MTWERVITQADIERLEAENAALRKVLEAATVVITDHEEGMNDREKSDCVCPRCTVIRALKAAVKAARKGGMG